MAVEGWEQGAGEVCVCVCVCVLECVALRRANKPETLGVPPELHCVAIARWAHSASATLPGMHVPCLE